MGLYDKYILPHFLNCACGSKPINYQRQKVVPLAEGVVLEIGIGSGLNLPFYQSANIEKLYGLDPSSELNELAKKVALKHQIPVEFILAGAENIPLPDNHVDTVMLTYTLCTIPDVPAANREIRRVLKPGGRMIFCEHGAAPDQNVARWQNRINPVWGKIAGGCNLNRDIPGLITQAGFSIQSMQEMYLPSTPKFAGYNYWGTATAD
jgi:ubiquinone/menaquinone biosynthesis C-methylase UbiE